MDNSVNPVCSDKNSYLNETLFKLKLFRKQQKIYFKNTPESDSLYRRRNKLILFGIGLLGYTITHKWINDYKILFSNRYSKLFSVSLLKLSLLLTWLLGTQLILKYMWYLNKIYKSYQFGLESVMKYSIITKYNRNSYELNNNLSINKNIETNRSILRDCYIYNNEFDIIDAPNLKKNQ